jgi:hypothetical protein
MTDATQTSHPNGLAPHFDKGFFDAMNSMTSQPFGYERVLEHMKSGRAITPQEAKDLYGIESLTSAIATLRQKKRWVIVTDRRRDESGASFSAYFLMPGATQPDDYQPPTPLFDVQAPKPAQAEDLPVAVPEPVSAPSLSIKAALPISVLNVRMGPEGPEIQMVPEGELESDHSFCRLSRSQIRYLSLNLKLFSDLDEENQK